MSINTPIAIASYTQGLWKASKIKDKRTGKETGDLKYGCEFIIDPSAVDMTELNQAIQAAVQEGIEKNLFSAEMTKDPKMHWPLMKGEEYKQGDPVYAGKLVMRAGRKEEFGPPLRVFNDGNYTPITDQSKLYSGCLVQANVNIAPYYSSSTSFGVTSYLNGVILIGDGDRLDNSQTVEQMFGGVKPGTSSPTDAPAGMQTNTGGDAPDAKMPWE